MALLSVETRKDYFKRLGLGNYNRKNILKMQKRYMLRKSDWDGCYGEDTDALLRHLWNVKRNCKDFRPEEFRCGCGGKYCSGYPTRMKAKELRHLQTIRTHFGKPVVVTSGLRCREFNNRLSGSSSQSFHMKGYAADIYIAGVTDTLSGRKKVVKFAKKQKNHHYSYCNGYNSNGYEVNAPNMGAAVHTDTK